MQLNDVDFYRPVFVLCPPAVRAVLRDCPPATGRREHAATVVSDHTSRLGRQLYQDRRVCFDEHTLGDLGIRVGLGPDRMFSVLAACPGDPLTTMGQIEAAVDELVRAARALTGPLVDALTAGTPSQAPAVGGLAGWRDA